MSYKKKRLKRQTTNLMFKKKKIQYTNRFMGVVWKKDTMLVCTANEMSINCVLMDFAAEITNKSSLI